MIHSPVSSGMAGLRMTMKKNRVQQMPTHVSLNFFSSSSSTCSPTHTHMYMYVQYIHVVERSVSSVECRGFESHPRQLIFLRKSDCLGCAVLLCLVVRLTLLASFFLPSHLSLKHEQVYSIHVYTMCNAHVHVKVFIYCTLFELLNGRNGEEKSISYLS